MANIAHNMTSELYESVCNELRPSGTWVLTEAVRKLLRLHISRLPQQAASEQETRYPTNPAGMRAFLDVFFARHYFQVQNSLIEHLTSESFVESLDDGEVRILDIGAGAAVASIAITDMVTCIAGYLRDRIGYHARVRIKFNYVLNDTSGICLSTGQRMLRDYSRFADCRDSIVSRIVPIQTAFPQNMRQLVRAQRHTGPFDIIVLSYILNPLNDQQGVDTVGEKISQLRGLLRPNGRVLVLQDRFSASLVAEIGRILGEDFKEDTLCQRVYSTQNDAETYEYTYYACLLEPIGSGVVTSRRCSVDLTR